MAKILSLFSLCFCVVFLGGCYDSKEIDTLAAVMAVGISKDDNSEEKLYTFAVSNAGGYEADTSGDGARLICYSQKGKNIEEAIDRVDRTISKTLSFSHVSVVLFSKDVAYGGIAKDVHFFEGNYKIRPQVMIAFTNISPGYYLKNLKPGLEANPEKYFQNILSSSKSHIKPLELMDFTNAYYCQKKAFAPIIYCDESAKVISEENSGLRSIGVIKDGRLIEEVIID